VAFFIIPVENSFRRKGSENFKRDRFGLVLRVLMPDSFEPRLARPSVAAAGMRTLLPGYEAHAVFSGDKVPGSPSP
jgi:hypothetical protein